MPSSSPAAGTVTPPPHDPVVLGLASDSRQVRPGYLFAALAGSRLDGARFIDDALTRGASALLVGTDVALPALDPAVAVVVDPEPRRRLALMAACFAGRQPATQVAVTGTSGKSSTVHFVRSLWQAIGHRAASIGTLGVITDRSARAGALTTPDAIALHADLAALAAEGIDHVAVEASSHGLDQFRLHGLRLTAAAFTNLTHEHLDYHHDMDAYLAAKLRLFDELLPAAGTAVINADSPAGAAVVESCRRRGLRTWRYGSAGSELRLRNVRPHAGGQALDLELFGRRYQVELPLVGDFQASNALAALGLVLACGAEIEAAAAALARLSGAPGRLQLVARHGCGAPVYVDYAHKPQALETVLTTLRAATTGRLVVVFGCGGDRDRAKRPLMGEIAARLADLAIVTDDNPRSEDAAEIRRAILAGVPAGRDNVRDVTEGRRAAIAAGLAALRGADDLLVVAGKGHETGQIVGSETLPFDDAEVARELLAPTANAGRPA